MREIVMDRIKRILKLFSPQKFSHKKIVDALIDYLHYQGWTVKSEFPLMFLGNRKKRIDICASKLIWKHRLPVVLIIEVKSSGNDDEIIHGLGQLFYYKTLSQLTWMETVRNPSPYEIYLAIAVPFCDFNTRLILIENGVGLYRVFKSGLNRFEVDESWNLRGDDFFKAHRGMPVTKIKENW